METFSCQIYICPILDCKHIGLITKFTTGKANYLRCGSKVEFPYLYVNHKHISLGTWSVELDCKAKRHFLLGPPLGRLRPLARSCFHRLESFFPGCGGPLKHKGIVVALWGCTGNYLSASFQFHSHPWAVL